MSYAGDPPDPSVPALAMPRSQAVAERLLVTVTPEASRAHHIPLPLAISHAAWSATIQSIPPGAPAVLTPRLSHLLAAVGRALTAGGAEYDGNMAYFSLPGTPGQPPTPLVLVASADEDLGSTVLSLLLEPELG